MQYKVVCKCSPFTTHTADRKTTRYLQRQRSWQCKSRLLQQTWSEPCPAYLPTQRGFSLDATALHKSGSGRLRKTRTVWADKEKLICVLRGKKRNIIIPNVMWIISATKNTSSDIGQWCHLVEGCETENAAFKVGQYLLHTAICYNCFLFMTTVQ